MKALPQTTKIIVTPDDNGYIVAINGERSGYFSNGGYAAAAYAEQLLEVRRLEKIIADHVDWLHSRTPQQVNDIDAGILRAMAAELRFLAGLETRT